MESRINSITALATQIGEIRERQRIVAIINSEIDRMGEKFETKQMDTLASLSIPAQIGRLVDILRLIDTVSE